MKQTTVDFPFDAVYLFPVCRALSVCAINMKTSCILWLLSSSFSFTYTQMLTFHCLTIYETCLNSVNCTKFVHSIIRNIIKIVATRCHIVRLNAPNSISAGPLPQTAGEAYSAPQTP